MKNWADSNLPLFFFGELMAICGWTLIGEMKAFQKIALS